VDIKKQVGRNVKKIRQERAWSQEELAFRSGLHRTYVSGVERGTRNPTVAVLQQLAEALEVSAGKLLNSDQISD